MATILKWMVSILLAGLIWLVTGYTVEYLRPYRKDHERSDRGLERWGMPVQFQRE